MKLLNSFVCKLSTYFVFYCSQASAEASLIKMGESLSLVWTPLVKIAAVSYFAIAVEHLFNSNIHYLWS